jgi:hypothetical protein
VIAVLGNRHAIQSLDHGETFEQLPKGKRATTVLFAEDTTLVDALKAVADLWPKHSADGKPPAWVATDSPALSSLLAENFGGVEIRDLELDSQEG